MGLDFDQSKQNAAKCEPSRHGKTQNVNVPASQNRLVSGRIKNLTTAAKLALLNYSVKWQVIKTFQLHTILEFCQLYILSILIAGIKAGICCFM